LTYFEQMVGPHNAVYAEESAEVEVLYANLGKLKTLTKKIQGSVARLDASGQIVKDAIGPIYSNTQQLQITNRNIDRVNEAIERLRQPLDAKGREEGIIRAGPRKAGFQQYMGALKRVDRALKDLTNSNMRSNQQAVQEFLELITMGHAQMQDLFRDTLKEDYRPIEPLHYITKQLAFPTISAEKCSQLHQVGDAIVSAAMHMLKNYHSNDNPAARIYLEIRGKYMTSSLENLATASINTSRRKDTSVYREGSSGISTYASGIEGMCLAEYENVSRIFQGEDGGAVYEATCRSALGHFASTLKELNTIIKSRVMSDCFLAFEIIDLVTPLSYRLDSQTGHLKSQFTDALRPIREASRSSLTEILDTTRAVAASTTTLPSDGASIPLVSETASRLHALSTFSRPVSSLLSSIGDGNWRPSSQLANSSNPSLLSMNIGPETENPTLLSHYFVDIVEALLSALEAKARAVHRTKSLQGCFLANSIAILDSAVRSSTDLSMYLGIAPHSSKLDQWRKKAATLYMDGWKEISIHLLDQINTKSNSAAASNRISGSSGDSAAIVKSLSGKEKDKKKEQFKAFNSSFDEMVARHKSLYMEKEVRASLGKEVQTVIEPLYARFWDRYHEIDKGKGKVVKYDKGALASVLSSLA
jgi:exocyst complex component 7